MSIIKILFFLIFLPIFVLGQGEVENFRKDTAAMQTITKENKKPRKKRSAYEKIYPDEYFKGSLKSYIAHLTNVDTNYIFSNKPKSIADSIYIEFTLPGALRYSSDVRELLLESYQHAYIFELRDTVLQEYETYYNVEVVDPSRLGKATIFDSGVFTVGIIRTIPYYWIFKLGYPLESITGSLWQVKTHENNDKSKPRIPIRSSISSDFGGLYVFSVPTQYYHLDNKSLGFLKFNNLLDVNPMLLEYGMQVKKITSPIIGKIIHFVDLVEYKKKYMRSFPPFTELPR
jgi:hypothetical protein